MTTPTSVKSPGRPMDVHREIALLDAALDLLAEVGYEQLTLTAVCERATASTKTMHHRWGNKDELLTAALHRAAYRVIDQSADVTATGSLRGDLLHNLAPNGGAQAQHPAKYLSGLLIAASDDGSVGRMAKDLVRLHHARLAETVLGWARERGEVGDDADPVLLADLTRAAILHQVLVADGQVDAAFVESLVDRVLLPVLTSRQSGGAK
ncbi:TetR/AcrR family transcriptional regulator C-terminal ligand-binding domain-containing protein [Streptomyces sp. ISL-22]|uniref:TetR/AcrR family transcriptional regulator n=1 Tax=unclassified Streptomyces TaxID=2593676 RepID=UPI001BECE691|nr:MULTISPECIES: TetR/AcrR family transcriptional regulator [unclassified Streptomyces]MBT2417351.1 TetR/AcrR family transcriptional regulator C-terminal ligand-binding domain-containing protein [Streptomyces sp. ISL-24]MBT2434613.1 TetR/AcrR family transcriptional regulator C-terminal ligand-binding domain-containing protein [Streptomyces sp. ISL-22]